jgi:hypothetical protein
LFLLALVRTYPVAVDLDAAFVAREPDGMAPATRHAAGSPVEVELFTADAERLAGLGARSEAAEKSIEDDAVADHDGLTLVGDGDAV